ncbi:hypothetical protein Pcinc_021724 [Petrolisthes cinctipes]|uniref:Uncharacterized protein n=1 Tax=Petrolisthes cinctipes TaxID=88211 RepID=A0AAE1FGU0_PETCI|nr:hypothetical protein Pcinc_021724 [Petrolisthes cinctipes]
MPLRNQPPTLQKATMLSIARNFDYICYGAKTREQMCKMIHDDTYTDVEGPFKNLPGTILTDLLATYRTDTKSRKLSRTQYHALVHPHIENMTLASSDGEAIAAFTLILARCQVHSGTSVYCVLYFSNL